MYSTEKYFQYFRIIYKSKEYKKYIYMCVCVSHFTVHRELIQHCKSSIILKKDHWLTEFALDTNMSTGLINSLE